MSQCVHGIASARIMNVLVDWSSKVIGDGGEIVFNPSGDVMVYNAETGRNGVAHPTANDNGHGRAIEDFANVVLHGATPKATAADSLGELRTALAIYKSAETKQWEKV